MRAGPFDRRIGLYRRVGTQQATGEVQQALTFVATVWAGRTPRSTLERFVAQQVAAEQVVGFRIRAGQPVTPAWEVRFGGRRYDVLGVQEVGRGEGLDLIARARAE